MSPSFSVSNGVKQGGVLSPILFGIYLDEMIYRIAKEKTGCFIGHIFAGCFGYADDATLLAPSKSALTKMSRIALSFSKEYNVRFNPIKVSFLFFSRNNCENDQFDFDGISLKCEKSVTHLGNTLHADGKCENIEGTIHDLYRRFNTLCPRSILLPWM